METKTILLAIMLLAIIAVSLPSDEKNMKPIKTDYGSYTIPLKIDPSEVEDSGIFYDVPESMPRIFVSE